MHALWLEWLHGALLSDLWGGEGWHWLCSEPTARESNANSSANCHHRLRMSQSCQVSLPPQQLHVNKKGCS